MARPERHHLIGDTMPVTDLTPNHLTKQEFGRRIHRLLLERGWRQAELSRRSGVAKDAISTYINGKVYPSSLNVKKIADAFGVKPEELLPNHTEAAVDSANPSIEVKATPDAKFAWVRVNRLMTAKAAGAIYQIATTDDINAE